MSIAQMGAVERNSRSNHMLNLFYDADTTSLWSEYVEYLRGFMPDGVCTSFDEIIAT
jgi:hypothetical protein